MAALMIESFPGNHQACPMPRDAAPLQRGAAVAGTDPQALFEIRRPEVNLAIWLGGALQALLAAGPFTAVAEGDIDEALVALANKLPAAPPLDLI